MAATTRLGPSALPTRLYGSTARQPRFLENLSLAEVLHRAIIRAAITETFTPSDVLTSTRVSTRVKTRLGLMALEARPYGLFSGRSPNKYVAETLLLGESSTRAITRGKTSESLALAESLVGIIVKLKALTPDALTLTETLTRLIRRATVAEGISFTESVASKKGPLIAEALTLSEQLVHQLLAPQGPPETLTFSESLTPLLIHSGPFLKLMTEALPIAEALVRLTRRTLPAEALALAESLASMKVLVRTVAQESLSLVETLAYATAYVRLISESMNVTETLVKRFIRPTVADVLPLTESLLAVKAKLLSLSDSLTVAEVLAIMTGKAVTDALTVGESMIRRVRLGGWIEPLGLSERLTITSSVIHTPESILLTAVTLTHATLADASVDSALLDDVSLEI